jgi:hypothetical protein
MHPRREGAFLVCDEENDKSKMDAHKMTGKSELVGLPTSVFDGFQMCGGALFWLATFVPGSIKLE